MTLTDQHIRAITFLACDIRKQTFGARQWDAGKVFDQITALRNRPLVSVHCAVARCAADPNVKREEAIGSPGSHWGDTMLPAAFVPQILASTERCSVCSKAERHCRTTHGVDMRNGIDPHEFESAAMAAKRRAEAEPAAVTGAIAALKAEVAETPAREPAARGLEDLADRNPELRAKVDAVRAALPGVVAPPMQMQETEMEAAE